MKYFNFLSFFPLAQALKRVGLYNLFSPYFMFTTYSSMLYTVSVFSEGVVLLAIYRCVCFYATGKRVVHSFANVFLFFLSLGHVKQETFFVR